MTDFVAINKKGDKRHGRLGHRIGDGGEGIVFAGAINSSLVIKIYKSHPELIQKKVEAMIQAPPRGQFVGPSASVQIAWPQEAVFDISGRFLGFSMPAVDIEKTTSLNDLGNPKARIREGIRNDYQFRVYVASNIASVVSHIHAAGHWLIDMKPDNMRLYPATGYVCVIDTDGFNVKGNEERFPPKVVTPGYLCPEAEGVTSKGKTIADLDEYQDRFALAVILFRLLANVHPSMGGARDSSVPPDEQSRIDQRQFFIDAAGKLIPPPQSVYDSLAEETQDMFRMAFLGPHRMRPAAADWHSHIQHLIDSSRLKTCKKSKEHFKFGSTCPWCRQDAALRKIVAGQARRAARRDNRSQRAVPALQATVGRNPVFTGRGTPVGAKASPSLGHPAATPAGSSYKNAPVTNVLGGIIGATIYSALAAGLIAVGGLAYQFFTGSRPALSPLTGVISLTTTAAALVFGTKRGLAFAQTNPSQTRLVAVAFVAAFSFVAYLAESGFVINHPTEPTRGTRELSSAGENRQLVLAIQQELRSRGYNPGLADGIFGPNTSSAISEFQSDLGITPDGQVSQHLIAALRENPLVTSRSDQSQGNLYGVTSSINTNDSDTNRTPFYLIPENTKVPTNGPTIKFCTRICDRSSRENMVQIRLQSYEVTVSGITLRFTMDNLSEVENFLLFSLTDSPRYSERIHLTDEQGHKYFALNGLEGGDREPFNRNATKLLIPPNSSIHFYVRFPMVSAGVDRVNFRSPKLHGHQSAWSMPGIVARSNRTLSASAAADRLAAPTAAEWIDRSTLALGRGNREAVVTLPINSCLIILGQGGMALPHHSYIDKQGIKRRLVTTVGLATNNREARSAKFRCTGGGCTIDYAIYPINNKNCANASLVNT